MTTTFKYILLSTVLVFLYLYNMEADSISGMFGVFWSDEGVYLLAAKNQVLFGQPHFFSGDLWRPEMMNPLLHQFALVTMSHSDPMTVKIAIALVVIAGAGLLAYIAGHIHQNSKYGIICFIAILLNPVLFFYARSGLTEGVQFFLFALALLLVYRLDLAKTLSHSIILAGLTGAVVALLFFAKLSAVAVCAGLSVAVLLTVLATVNDPRKHYVIAAYVLVGIVVTVTCFYFMVGDDFHFWWRSNITTNVTRKVSINPFRIIRILVRRMPEIAHHITLMPLLGLYSLSLLPLSRQPKQSFSYILCVMASVIILIEATFGAEMSRNFFSFNMLAFLAGLSVCDYIKNGVVFDFRNDLQLSRLCTILILMPICGVAFLLFWTASHLDYIYVFLCLAFLSLMAAAISRQSSKRITAVTLASLFAVLPMIYQSLFPSFTRQQSIVALESIIDTDSIVSGGSAPWYFYGLKRRIIFANCWYANYLNDIPVKFDYIMAQDNPPCPISAEFKPVYNFTIFYPEISPTSTKGWKSTSKDWNFYQNVTLLKKQ